jgi:3-(3-hydroxy-phenyl)propionate hydroxylase
MMLKTYQYRTYEYTPCHEQQTGEIVRHPVIVVGGGPTGLTAACDLTQQGIHVVLLDDDNTVSEGSRAICFAQRSLEVFERLGVVAPMRDKGVTWNVGKLFYKADEVFRFNLLPEAGHAHPAFINLQQYYAEQYLVDDLLAQPLADVRWLNKVVAVEPHDDFVRVTVETPDGRYQTECDWLIAADGARSTVRHELGLPWAGEHYEEKFLITDIVMTADFPPERWFWFAPSFGGGHSALLHMQPDNVYRLDFQLGRDADPIKAAKPENIIPRVKAMIGDDVSFELEWVSVYSFSSHQLDKFVHGRVIFAGDAAHLMSVFGARGANSGIQDADNLVWKLKLMLDGKAPIDLLHSYSTERVYAARENLLYTGSSVKFISPSSPGALALRNAVLELAQSYEFARPLINSGRLSTATVMADSPLNTADEDVFDTRLIPGAPCVDAPVQIDGNDGYLLAQLGGQFDGLLYVADVAQLTPEMWASLRQLAQGAVAIRPLLITPHKEESASPDADGLPIIVDTQGYVKQRYDMQDGTFYLCRPDQTICARWRQLDVAKVQAALARACCL